jgi:tetratricopeptide (TPR) repeat protein
MKKTATKAGRSQAKRKAAAPGVRQAKADTAPRVLKEKPAALAVAEAPGPSIGEKQQSELFDQAIALFRAGSFAQARTLFEKATAGPVREMAHAARVHAQICDRRASQGLPAPASAEDHYNYAIALINRRELEAAEGHLQEALKLAPNADHIHYALALARGLRGEIQRAHESLRRAIEIDPRNRAQARNDPDFAEFYHYPPLAGLLFPDRQRRG